MKTALVLPLVCLILVASNAQPTCNDWTQLIDCQGAASDPTATPESQCCDKVKQYEPEPDCLCSILLSARSAAQQTGLPFNLQAALTIPSKCHVRIPPGYTCAGIPIPSQEN